MGLFLSLSVVIGKSEEQVTKSIKDFVGTFNGGLEELTGGIDDSFSVFYQQGNNTTVLYPDSFLKWDPASEFISKELNTSVFSCHIHDGDLWMFVLYNNGEVIAQFNPIPEYWDDSVGQEEIDEWKGDAGVISKYVSELLPNLISNYFVHWDSENGIEGKAYPDDEYNYGDCWQLIDFMKKIGAAYPIDEKGKPIGKVYKLWTEN